MGTIYVSKNRKPMSVNTGDGDVVSVSPDGEVEVHSMCASTSRRIRSGFLVEKPAKRFSKKPVAQLIARKKVKSAPNVMGGFASISAKRLSEKSPEKPVASGKERFEENVSVEDVEEVKDTGTLSTTKAKRKNTGKASSSKAQ